ncbi:PEP-CTERM sorting domain-containing protein [Massilia sp. P8910]|uniref:PEP-CTERM sorting domain-containing protein n=1 Tax=Massilia antarctica TaxID=2765360 RepID=UPI001E2F61FE|nr:PEP-CTERM sorting domain-containing protein [Massilia antarctica]MCE3604462.1 PEP-CTERM sorting domain-containing protein [Massilia antarctica]
MKHTALALSFAASLAALPAQAQVSYSATTSISNIRYTLTDLDLNDGVTPYIRYDTAEHSVFVAREWDMDAGHDQEDSRELSYFDQQTTAFDTSTAGTHSKHLQVAADIRGTTLDTLAMSNTATVSGSGRGGTHSDIALDRVFVLSPNTSMSISLDVSTFVSSSGEALEGRANSYAYIRIGDNNRTYDLRADVQGPGEKQVKHTFTTTIQTKNGEYWVNSELWVRAHASVDGVSPVPEPQTYAMLLAGLGLIGWRLVRSRQA